MAPTIIVGDDESAGDVAAALLDAADSQRDVRVRTDLSRPAFEVPDALYQKHVGRRKRSEDEQRVNAVDELVDADDAEHAIVSEDELPDGARVVDPADVGGALVSDELPDAARVVAPPSNAEQPNTGDTGTATDGDAGNRANSDDDARTEGSPADDPEPPKPRKRASRSRAAKSTPAAAGPAE